MIPNPHSRRFDPRWLSTPIKTDGEELFGAPAAELRFADEESMNDRALRDFDEAIEQIVSEECRVCPLCGVIVDRDGTVVNREPSNPGFGTILKRND
jgi:hypothetical protein